MKEIGERLKETRESIGVTIEEASEDLKIRVSQIENIENGNMSAFKDVFSLKYFIRDYSKYLGLDYEEMVDEYNEYLFDYTSKISLKDIKRASKKVKTKNDVKRIASPYTIEKRTFEIPKGVVYAAVILFILTLGYLAITIINQEEDDFVDGIIVMDTE